MVAAGVCTSPSKPEAQQQQDQPATAVQQPRKSVGVETPLTAPAQAQDITVDVERHPVQTRYPTLPVVSPKHVRPDGWRKTGHSELEWSTTGKEIGRNRLGEEHTSKDYARKMNQHDALAVGTTTLPSGAMNITGTTGHEIGKNETGQEHTPLAYAVRTPNSALAVGTQTLPQGEMSSSFDDGTTHGDLQPYDSKALPGREYYHSALSVGSQVMPSGPMQIDGTTAHEIGKDANNREHTPSDYPRRAPNMAIAVGTTAIPYEGYFNIAAAGGAKAPTQTSLAFPSRLRKD